MTDTKLIPVTDATFAEQVLGSATPVLVKFEAQWCGPCKAMKPMVDEIAAEYSGRLTVATVDIEENQQTVYRLGVRAVPTVVLFKNGKFSPRRSGCRARRTSPRSSIRRWRRPRRRRFELECALQPEDAEQRGKSAHRVLAAYAAAWFSVARGACRRRSAAQNDNNASTC